ncbi:MAG: Rrf2 family transcriptional regulator [Chloroflexota bacterium]
MKISTKGEYGIRALIELTQHIGEGYIQSTTIATARHIPENYLYQLLITLRKAGLIRSRRGPQGGHMLARAPERINLEEIVIALEGPIEPVGCIQEDMLSDCLLQGACPVREVWRRVSDSTSAILQGTSLADLARREAEKRAALGDLVG